MQLSGRERLKAYRDKHGYKQYELAELLELDETHLSQILSGKRRPGLPIAVRIEDICGIPAKSWLLTQRGSRRGTKGENQDETVQIGQ